MESGPLRRSEISTMTVWVADTVKLDGSYAKRLHNVSVRCRKDLEPGGFPSGMQA